MISLLIVLILTVENSLEFNLQAFYSVIQSRVSLLQLIASKIGRMEHYKLEVDCGFVHFNFH